MPEKNTSRPAGIPSNSPGLSSNEKAIINSIPIPVLRDLFSRVWEVKLRLQFTGWLQYIPVAMITFIIFLISFLVRVLGSRPAGNFIALIGFLLLALLVFDLVTVKFRLRPTERLPKRKDHLDVFDLMRARRSCRSFQTRKLTHADYQELMEHVRIRTSAPTIGKAPVRIEYISAPLTVWPTVNATEFLVAIAPLQYDRTAVIDVGRTLQKIVIDATRMGLGTCWIGPGADHISIKRHLGNRFNAERDHIICVCAVGYKSWFIPVFIRVFNAQFYRRLPISKLFFADTKFEAPLDLNAAPYNHFGRTYEVCQWSPSSYNGQTTRCAAVTKSGEGTGGPRLVRFDFYQTTASRFYAPVAAGIWCADWELGCDALGIHGCFIVLPPEEIGEQDQKTDNSLPQYDVSWIPTDRLVD